MKGNNNKMIKTSHWVLLLPAQFVFRRKRIRPIVCCSSDLAFRLEITCDTITRDLWLVILYTTTPQLDNWKLLPITSRDYIECARLSLRQRWKLLLTKLTV